MEKVSVLNDEDKKFLEDHWYCAALPNEVTGKPMRRVICNEPIVFYRGTRGEAVAIEDRCSHRQAPLSTGIVRDNNIECSYHGFVFDKNGRCVYIPHQDTIPSRAHIRAYPVAEKWGFIWIWRGVAEKADTGDIPQLPWTEDPGHRPVFLYFFVKANHQLVADNLLDISHADYLHSNTLGSKSGVMDGPQPDKVEFRIWQEGDKVHSYRKLTNVRVGAYPQRWGSFTRNVDRTNIQMWEAPNTVHVHLEFENDENKITLNHDHIMTPETETTTHYFMDFTRDFSFGESYPTDEDMYKEQNAVIGTEDLPMIEAQQANIDFFNGVIDVPVKADKLVSAVHRHLVDMYTARGMAVPAYVLVQR
ncbi:MAG: aromatic ring-hydroxylating dioxygenase subunit alpha [Pseudomonadota bacterium]|nr:aromatic ring-hydroxylating dioxygenase subunit alpha [Pseudomonadota bacterium]